MENRLGTMIIDGRIIDLDKLSLKELKEIQANLKKKENEIRNKIDNLLKTEENETVKEIEKILNS